MAWPGWILTFDSWHQYSIFVGFIADCFLFFSLKPDLPVPWKLAFPLIARFSYLVFVSAVFPALTLFFAWLASGLLDLSPIALISWICTVLLFFCCLSLLRYAAFCCVSRLFQRRIELSRTELFTLVTTSLFECLTRLVLLNSFM